MAITVRELVAKLGFDVDDKPLKRFDVQLGNVRKHLTRLFVAASSATAGIVALGRATAHAGEAIAVASKLTGFSTTQYQQLRGAAELAGIAQDKFRGSMVSFARRLAEAQQGGGPAAETFKRLGIVFEDNEGQLKSTHQMLIEVAERFKRLESDITKTAHAQNLFNFSGRELTILLSQGEEGVNKLVQQYESLGYVMDEAAIEKAELVTQQFTQIKQALNGLRHEIGVMLLPILHELLENFLAWFRANRQLIQQNLTLLVRLLTLAMQALMAVVKVIVKGFEQFAKVVGGTERAVTLLTMALGVLISAKFIKGLARLAGSLGAVAKGATRSAAAVRSVAGGSKLAGAASWAKGMAGKGLRLARSGTTFGLATIAAADVLKGLMGQDTVSRRISVGLERGIKAGWNKASGFTRPLFEPSVPSAPLQMNTTIEVTVPPGTPEAQQYVLKQAADSAFQEFWDTQLRHTLMTHKAIE